MKLELGQKWQENETGKLYRVVYIKPPYVSCMLVGTTKSKSTVIDYFVKVHSLLVSEDAPLSA